MTLQEIMAGFRRGFGPPAMAPGDDQVDLSLWIPYPEADDRAHAAELGVPPGGDIYIHDLPNRWRKFATPHPRRNWTTGCIAVADAELREQSSLVSTGTRVVIHP